MQPENLIYGDLQRQREILADILASDDNDRSLDDDEDDTSSSRALMNAGANPLAGPSLWSTAGSGEGGGNVFGRMPYGGHVQQLHGGLARLAGIILFYPSPYTDVYVCPAIVYVGIGRQEPQATLEFMLSHLGIGSSTYVVGVYV